MELASDYAHIDFADDEEEVDFESPANPLFEDSTRTFLPPVFNNATLSSQTNGLQQFKSLQEFQSAQSAPMSFPFGAPTPAAAAPAPFSFGAAPQAFSSSSFGAFGGPATASPFGAPAPSIFSAPAPSMFSAPAFGRAPQATPFGAPSAEAFPRPPSSFSFGGTPTAVPTAPYVAPPPLKKKTVRSRKLNTNVLSVRLGTLGTDVAICTGDPIFCSACNSALNKFSVTSTATSSNSNNSAASWACEFCNNTNPVHIQDAEEIPKEESTDYILEPPTQFKADSEDDSMIIFCVDISGSMTTSYEIDKKIKLRGSGVDKLAHLNTERGDQFLPGQNRNVTYVSRLQCLQGAIDTQIEAIAKEHPNKRVGIVTFNGEVAVLGDASQPAVIVTGDKLHSYDDLVQEAANIGGWLPISKCAKALSDRIFALEEGGSTALGPALVVSTAIACKKPGSKIVICTDGLANVGIGALDDVHTDAQRAEKEAFFSKVGTYAKSCGVAISVISIRGTDCKIENLGMLAELTSGNVNIVDPLHIANEFASILSAPVLATNVTVSVVLHKGLFVQDLESSSRLNSAAVQQSYVIKEVGNVTADSDLTFEYGVRPKAELEKMLNLAEVKQLPFQIQIRFTKLDGMKCIRTISKLVPITFDREVAEGAANVGVLGLAGVQKPASIAQYSGDYGASRAVSMQSAQLLQRVARTPAQQAEAAIFLGHQQGLERELRAVSHVEEAYENDEADMDEETKSKSKKSRRNDQTSNVLYQAKNMSHRRKY